MTMLSTSRNRRLAKSTRAPVRGRKRLSSVANAMRLLKAFSDDESEIGISELAQRLGLAKCTVHRLASTLIEQRVLEQNPHNARYRLGLLMFELGALVRRKMDVSAEASPLLKALMEKTGETVYLTVLDDYTALYVNRVESRRAIRSGYGHGTRAPLHCTALGKALLAHQAAAYIDAVIARGLPRRTAATITQPAALRRELETIRARGYALEDEEVEPGLRGIAAGVRNDAGDVIAAIGISGPAHRLTRKTLAACARDLIDAADSISRRLGYEATAERRA